MLVVIIGLGNIDFFILFIIVLVGVLGLCIMGGDDGGILFGLLVMFGVGVGIGLFNYLLICLLQILFIIVIMLLFFILQLLVIYVGQGFKIMLL